MKNYSRKSLNYSETKYLKNSIWNGVSEEDTVKWFSEFKISEVPTPAVFYDVEELFQLPRPASITIYTYLPVK